MNKRVWNPYLAGSLAGVLLVLSVLVAGHFLGASTTFARSASVIEKAVGIDPSQFAYFTTKNGKYGPASLPNWQLMFVIGIIIGAFIASKLSGEFRMQTVPDMWQQRFGPSAVKRGIIAFIGGVIGLVGARLAGG
jgi:hypothetical protein